MRCTVDLPSPSPQPSFATTSGCCRPAALAPFFAGPWPAPLRLRSAVCCPDDEFPVLACHSFRTAPSSVQSWAAMCSVPTRSGSSSCPPQERGSKTPRTPREPEAGERFGIQAPLPSIRLKLQRDCLQDLALVERAAKTTRREHIEQEIVRRFNGTQLSDWRNTPPAIASKTVIDWTNADIGDALRPYEARFANLKPSAWAKVHEYALTETEGAQ
jgi:hypothetical protein